jgi:lipase
VLLLHGITGCGLYWSVQIAQLVAAGYRVTAPDGRGHGTSDRASDYATATIAADAAALISALGLVKPTVIGHSMGGAQSLFLASAHPELVGRVILEDPAVWPRGGDDA